MELDITQHGKKSLDRDKAKKLALQAIKAEWAKDYLVAEFKWACASLCCRPEKESFCKNRSATCRKLTSVKGTLII